MMLKSALFAAVLAGMAAAGASSASAWSGSGYRSWSGPSYHRHHHVRPFLRTETRCIGRYRVLLRINHWGRVVSRSVIGRCGFSHRFWARLNRN